MIQVTAYLQPINCSENGLQVREDKSWCEELLLPDVEQSAHNDLVSLWMHSRTQSIPLDAYSWKP